MALRQQGKPNNSRGLRMTPPTLTDVKPLADYQLWVRFSDGVEGTGDLSEFVGDGVFSAWEDHREFERVRIGPSGELAWGEEIDMCPEAIYVKITGNKPEDMFPKLQALPQYAGDKPLLRHQHQVALW